MFPSRRPRTVWTWKKPEKRSVLWFLSDEEKERYREEYLRTSYKHMVEKYHIARADLKELLGQKERPIRNVFYVLVQDTEIFDRVKKEYYSKTSADFAQKYRIGMRQARKLFGVKQWNKVKRPVERAKPIEIDRTVREQAYWEDQAYWIERGIG